MQHSPSLALVALAALLAPSAALAAVSPLSDDVLQKVLTNALTSSLSWENGTLARALTDFYYPAVSIYTPGFTTALANRSNALAEDTWVGALAKATLESKVASFGRQSLNGTNAVNGSRDYLSLLDDGAAGDPASLGEVVFWANASNWTDFNYGVAASDEIVFLTEVVPRTSDGAISHRRDQAQLWSDSTFMVPPYLAYYAAMTNNQTLMTEAYNQCAQYRKVLKGDNGLWKHIMLGEGSIDEGDWATGNGWAAGGMIRVLATIKNSPMSSSFQSQQTDLQSWIEEILSAADAHQLTNGTMHNYITNRTYFLDTAGPIMLASAAYRLSAMDLTSVYVPYAERTYNFTANYLNSDAGSDGWVVPVVDPYNWYGSGSKSPEAQTFVYIMETARREWVNQGSRNESGVASPGDDGTSGAGLGFDLGLGKMTGAVLLAALGLAVF